MRYSFFVWLAVAVALGQQGVEQLFESELAAGVAFLSGAMLASAGVVRAFVNGVFGAGHRVESRVGETR